MVTYHPLIFADIYMDVVKSRVVKMDIVDADIFLELRLNEYMESVFTCESTHVSKIKEDYFYSDAFVADLTFISATIVKCISAEPFMKYLLKVIKLGAPELKPAMILDEIIEGLQVIKATNNAIEIKVEA